MSLVHLSYQETKELLTAAVEARGANFTYHPLQEVGDTACAYFKDDGTPSCIIGQVLAAKGVGLADITEVQLDFLDANTTGIGFLIKHGVVAVDGEATKTLLCVAQGNQDSGSPWGEALTEALAATEGVLA